MSKKINIAVFPCGSEVGLEIHRALKYYRHFNLVGLNSASDHGRMVYEEYQGEIPFLDEENFTSEMKKIIQDYKIHFLIPAMDDAGYILKKNEHNFGCEVLYPELETAEIIRKKSTTYEYLQDVIKTPIVFKSIPGDEGHFPLFIKPNIGYGSRGARIVKKKQELESIADELNEYIMMENLPGNEFTVDCFSNGNGRLLFSGARIRDRVRMGISVSTKTVNNQKPFRKLAEKISEKLKLKGVWFFQVKEDVNRNLTLLEIAGRVSGSMALYRGLGINFIASDIFQRLGEKIQIPDLIHSNALLERSFDCKMEINLKFDTVYCDLDDCLIINNKINHNLISFLYQCINKGKRLVLLTRHKKNPKETLGEFRLCGLFDDILHLTDKSISKSKYIKNKNAIFIDDSFTERRSVSGACGIPTFSPDGIDLLNINYGE